MPSELVEKPPEVAEVPMVNAVPGLPTVPLIETVCTGLFWPIVEGLISTMEKVVAEAVPLSGDSTAKLPAVNEPAEASAGTDARVAIKKVWNAGLGGVSSALVCRGTKSFSVADF